MSLPSSCRAASLLLALLWGAPLAALDLRPPVALCALALSFVGLLFGLFFLVTSVWFWQVAGFSFATVFTQEFELRG